MPAGHPEVAHPNRTLFELITADIAVHRGDTGFAYEAWMDAAKNEKSADLAKLAWEAAVATRNPEKPLPQLRYGSTAIPQLLKRG